MIDITTKLRIDELNYKNGLNYLSGGIYTQVYNINPRFYVSSGISFLDQINTTFGSLVG